MRNSAFLPEERSRMRTYLFFVSFFVFPWGNPIETVILEDRQRVYSNEQLKVLLPFEIDRKY